MGLCPFCRAQRAGLVLQPGVLLVKLSRLGLGLGARALGTKNPLKVQFPSQDRLFVVPRVVTSRDRVPSDPLGDVPPDLVHNPDPELGEETA